MSLHDSDDATNDKCKEVDDKNKCNVNRSINRDIMSNNCQDVNTHLSLLSSIKK